ncbi:MAG: hypothetical protein MUC94_03570 [bacterium]|jgi:hypothetical protein|nr:hypothetical protein [candidate division KSB1 bacterium]MCU0643318.1 hypothetical protein [bacterium]
MAKDRSFAAKVAKGAIDALNAKKCPVCGEIPNSVLLVQSEQKKVSPNWRFKEKFVSVCKCNEKEIYA